MRIVTLARGRVKAGRFRVRFPTAKACRPRNPTGGTASLPRRWYKPSRWAGLAGSCERHRVNRSTPVFQRVNTLQVHIMCLAWGEHRLFRTPWARLHPRPVLHSHIRAHMRRALPTPRPRHLWGAPLSPVFITHLTRVRMCPHMHRHT